MEYMGILLFLWIVGGSCVGLFIVDRLDSSRVARTDRDGRRDGVRPLETS